jgi:hypothetical protein
MFYQKNLPLWERLLRFAAGAAMVACGLIGLKDLPIGYLVAGAGVFTILTGAVGFCPACALAGRRLKNAGNGQAQ